MKNRVIYILLAFCTLLFSQCFKFINAEPQTPVDQTVIVLSADRKPLQGKTLRLTGSDLRTPNGNTAVTDAQGKANFTFKWNEFHESGTNNWNIDVVTDDKTLQTNRVRDQFQFTDRRKFDRTKFNPDTITIDSLVPFKIRFKTKSRVHELSFELWSETRSDKFMISEKIKIPPQYLDTIITVKAFKQSKFSIDMRILYSDKATVANPTPWGSTFGDIPKNFPRDSAFLVYNAWE